MKLRYALGLLVLLAGSSILAQQADTLPRGAVDRRSVRASESVESFRPAGDMRIWQFFAKQTTFGQLTSIVTGRRDIDGRPVLTLRESLQIDFTKIGGEAQETVSGETFVTSSGYFAGCDLKIGPSDQAERLVMSPSDGELNGYFTRGGEENEIEQVWPGENYFWDPHLVDQLEIFLARHDLEIGTVIDDSLFLPQSLLHARIAGQVIYFMWQEIYKGRIDSVFIIRLTEPSNYQLYFTPDKKLVRVDMIDQGIRVYQDVVQKTSVKTPSEPLSQSRTPFSLRGLLFKLPHYLAFVVIGGLAILLLTPRAFRWRASYLSLPVGVVLYVLTVLLVNPALIWMARHWVDLQSMFGSSFYLAGAVLPLITGLIQVLLIFGGLSLVVKLTDVRPYQWCGLGVFVGAAFGLAESMYVSGWQIEVLFDWALLERAVMIVTYTATGALIGRFLSGDRVHLVWAIIAAALVNGAGRYLPLLVQTRKIRLEAVHLVMAIGAVIFLLVVVILTRRVPVRHYETSSEEAPPNQD